MILTWFSQAWISPSRSRWPGRSVVILRDGTPDIEALESIVSVPPCDDIWTPDADVSEGRNLGMVSIPKTGATDSSPLSSSDTVEIPKGTGHSVFSPIASASSVTGAGGNRISGS